MPLYRSRLALKVLLFANTDWYLFNFRLSLAYALRDRGYEILLLSPPGDYGRRLVDMGFDWRPLPMKRQSLQPLSELKLLVQLVRLLKDEDVDIVHGFTIKAAVYGSLAARMAGGVARISAVAGMGYVFTSSDMKARLLKPIVRAVIKLAASGRNSRIILQNPDDVDAFLRYRLAEEQYVRLIKGSGVDTSLFVPSESQGRDSSTVVVLFAARLLWDKGLREFIEAATIVRKKSAGVCFLLAGEPDEGNPAAVSTAEVEGWHASGKVQWLGQVSNMPELLQSVDIMVLPSYREGLPKGLVEAAAVELPLIATDVPGCREVVIHGVNGLLVPAHDAEALANAIVCLIQDRELRAEMGVRGRKKVLAEFDEEVVIRETLAVYDELL